MSMVFDEAETEKQEEKEEISQQEIQNNVVVEDDKDWWLEEDAFGIEKNDKKNPFGAKK